LSTTATTLAQLQEIWMCSSHANIKYIAIYR